MAGCGSPCFPPDIISYLLEELNLGTAYPAKNIREVINKINKLIYALNKISQDLLPFSKHNRTLPSLGFGSTHRTPSDYKNWEFENPDLGSWAPKDEDFYSWVNKLNPEDEHRGWTGVYKSD